MKIAVIGAGSWGTTLANLLSDNNHQVNLWVREPELLEIIKTKGENVWFLPGTPVNQNIFVSSSLAEVLEGVDLYLSVVPCQFLRALLKQAKPYFSNQPAIVCASKGIEVENLKPMSQIVDDELNDLQPKYYILSGPSFAKEVSQGLPTAVTLGGPNKQSGYKIQKIFSTKNFRVYFSSDYKGVELGGALKNIIAIAAGICDGLGFGTNARAALITRGLAEMSRLGVALGAKQKTFMGLSGMGDLILTCTGDLSRNRQVGLQLGQGKTIDQILNSMKMVAEGVKTTEAVFRLSRQLQVELPITEQIYQTLYQDKDPAVSVQDLMARELKEE